MKKIIVFHFNPLELYPPTMNFLDCLQRRLSKSDRVLVYTTRLLANTELYTPHGNQITIKRIASYTLGLPVAKRMFGYLSYFMISFLQSIRFSPSKVFYYETISSFTPYLLMRWFGSRIELFIHYHEYMNAEEYARMMLNKVFHRLERKIYYRAKWISHTNAYRMKLFLEDLNRPELTNTHILPNYPPAAWVSDAKDKIEQPIKLIYVGTVGSLELLYIREIFDWIRSESGTVLLDIYSFRVADEVRQFGEEWNVPYIKWKGSVPYRKLPKLLKQYDVGIILYKGVSINSIYNAPNKLFEYIACGLDVWYPEEMAASQEYNSLVCWPKVIPLNFSKLEMYNVEELVEHEAGKRRFVDFTCEKACDNLITLICA
jgi:hypothetical protein